MLPGHEPTPVGPGKGTILLSLALAVVAWYAIRETTSFEFLVDQVPIQIATDVGWTVLDQSEKTVDIRFLGSRADLAGLTRERVRVVVDARGSGGREGAEQEVRLRPAQVQFAGGARATLVTPSSLRFSVDREGTQAFPINADLQGQLPEGYELRAVEATPKTAEVTGPLSRVGATSAVKTVPIDLEGRIRPFELLDVPLLPPANAPLARLNPVRVRIQVQIVANTQERTLDRIPVRWLVSPGAATGRITPATVSVRCSGPADALKRLTEGDIFAFINERGDGRDPEDVRLVSVRAPEGIRVIGWEPSQVRIETRSAESP